MSQSHLAVQRWESVVTEGAIPFGPTVNNTKHLQFCCHTDDLPPTPTNIHPPFDAPFTVVKVSICFIVTVVFITYCLEECDLKLYFHRLH